MRGLKFLSFLHHSYLLIVAPFTGAWIEIFLKIINFSVDNVAPFTGAWIEIKVLAADEYRNPRRTLHGCVD